jgi:hypothetical protein
MEGSLFLEAGLSDRFGLFFRGVRAKVPDLDAIDLEGAPITPGGPPLSLVVVELGRGTLGHVGPGLGSDSVLEVSGSSSDGQVKDEVVGSVEGGVLVLGVLPGIGPVAHSGLVPVALSTVIHLQDTVGIIIEVGVDLLVIPVEAESVEGIGEASSGGGLFSVGLGVLVGEVVGAPMHGGAEGLRSSSEFTGVVGVSTAFHDIDLTTGGPLSVLIVAGEAPDSGPEPVSLGQLGLDFDSSVLEGEGVDGGELATHDGVDVVISIAGPAASVEEVSGALISRRAAPQFIGVSCADGLLSDFVFGEDGLDIEDTVLHEGGGSVVVVELELPVASTGEGDVVPPLGKVEEIEVVLEDQLGVGDEEDREKDTNYLHPSGTT